MNQRSSRYIRTVSLLAAAMTFAVTFTPAQPCYGQTRMKRIPVTDHPVFADDLGYDRLAGAVSASIDYYGKMPKNRIFAFGDDRYAAKDLAGGLVRFVAFVQSGPSEEKLRDFMDEHAALYAFEEEEETVDILFTGYFEPELAGSRTKSKPFLHPVHGRPSDLVAFDISEFAGCDQQTAIGRYTGGTIKPYYDRRTIETGNVLEKTADAIAWVSDPVGLFFLHVQGSGKIRLVEDGSLINVQYDITNGRSYRSIGKYLIDRGKITPEEMSMQAIRAYLANHPGEMEEVFHYNPRYVFFRETTHGPMGCLGTELIPGRSIALDQAISPAGALLFIEARKPACDRDITIENWVDFKRFAVNQDTGAAIRGPARADIFWGSGDYAQTAAGYMKHRGRLYFVVIKP